MTGAVEDVAIRYTTDGAAGCWLSDTVLPDRFCELVSGIFDGRSGLRAPQPLGEPAIIAADH